jgi:hypothetical protein
MSMVWHVFPESGALWNETYMQTNTDYGTKVLMDKAISCQGTKSTKKNVNLQIKYSDYFKYR